LFLESGGCGDYLSKKNLFLFKFPLFKLVYWFVAALMVVTGKGRWGEVDD
jgi:hypothetical protein